MPSVDEHHKQYSSNVSVIDELYKLVKPPYDWMVTVYFYAVVHLVEKKLAELNYHTDNHLDRGTLVKKLLKNIQISYETLYIESQNARYNCVEMTAGKVNVAKSHFQQIEKYFQK